MSMTYTCDRCGAPAQDEDGLLAGSIQFRLGRTPTRDRQGEPTFLLSGDLCWTCRVGLVEWWTSGAVPARITFPVGARSLPDHDRSGGDR